MHSMKNEYHSQGKHSECQEKPWYQVIDGGLVELLLQGVSCDELLVDYEYSYEKIQEMCEFIYCTPPDTLLEMLEELEALWEEWEECAFY